MGGTKPPLIEGMGLDDFGLPLKSNEVALLVATQHTAQN